MELRISCCGVFEVYDTIHTSIKNMALEHGTVVFAIIEASTAGSLCRVWVGLALPPSSEPGWWYVGANAKLAAM